MRSHELRRRTVAAVTALAFVAVAALAPRAANANWTPVNWTLCGGRFTADPLEYVEQPVLTVYELQGSTYVPLTFGVGYSATPGFMFTDPKTNVTTIPILFPKTGDYLAVMQFTPFIADAQALQVRTSGNYWRPEDYYKGVFSPPEPLITNITFQIYKQGGKTAVPDGTEVLFGGYSPDIDPYAAQTESGKVVTFGLSGTKYPGAPCVSNLRRRSLPSGYPALANTYFVQVPDVGGQGSFCGLVDIRNSNSTIDIVLQSNGCAVALATEQRSL